MTETDIVEFWIKQALLVIWVVALVCVLVTELRSRSSDVRLIPRCARCDGMRDTYHKCPDSVEASDG